jgi:chemotaxis signal transduction protein/nucleoid-associated protein YgaU
MSRAAHVTNALIIHLLRKLNDYRLFCPVIRQPSEYLILVFNVGAYTFCVPALEVESVTKKPVTSITSVPGSPNAVAGILAYRGQIVTVIDLHCKLGLPVPRETASGLLIIARMDDDLTAFWADGVTDVISSSAVQWHPVTANTSFTAVNKLGTHDDLFLMHTCLASLALMEDSLQEDSQFLRFTEALGIRSSVKIETVPEMARLDECKNTESPDAKGPEEKACRAEKIEKVLPAPGTHPTPKVKAGKPYTIIQPNTSRISISKTNSKTRATPVPTIPSKAQPVEIQKAGRSSQVLEIGKSSSSGIAGSMLEKASTRPAKGHGFNHKEQAPAEPLSTPLNGNRRSKFLWIAAGIIGFGLLLALLIRPWHHRETTYAILAPPIPPVGMAAAPAKSSPASVFPEAVWATAEKVLVVEKQPEAEPPHRAPSEKRPAKLAVQSVVKAPAAEAGEGFGEDAETDKAPSASDYEDSRHQELLRIETKGFTLTVERPQADGSIPPPPDSQTGGPQIGSDEMLVHIVVKGDTLWDIAKSYLGNPMLYPELAKLSYIKDPHWIYPRDVIRIVRRY